MSVPEKSAQYGPNVALMAIFTATFLVFFRFYFGVKRYFYPKTKIPFGQRPILVVFNHTSFIDVPMLAVALGFGFTRRVRGAAKKELFENWRTKWLIRALGGFPVDRDKLDIDSVKLIMQFLKENRVVVIAPEGTRSETGEVGPFNPAFVKLAIKSQSLIVPVGIRGANKAMPKGASLPRPHRITLKVGEPIDFSTYPPEQTHKENYEALSEQIRQVIIDLSH